MDRESQALNQEILRFIARFAESQASDALFQKLALKTYCYQFKRNEHYRRYSILSTKTPRNVRHWKDIPAIPAAGFKELVLAAFPVKKCVKIFRTSGTTQNLSARGAHFFDTMKLYEAAIIPAFKKFCLPDRVALSYFLLIDPPRSAPHSSLSHMMGVVDKRFAGGKGKYYVHEANDRRNGFRNPSLCWDML